MCADKAMLGIKATVGEVLVFIMDVQDLNLSLSPDSQTLTRECVIIIYTCFKVIDKLDSVSKPMIATEVRRLA